VSGLEPYQERFIELLAEHDVIRFGEFTLKSGRKSPYFINAGGFRTGRAIRALGLAYAERILAARLEPEVVFGPSYKGVPLAVATAIALAEKGHDAAFSFDRKEAKDHGEGGTFVGAAPRDGQRVVIVDDVITSGSSIEHAACLLQSAAAVRIAGVIVAVDRQERGRAKSTLQELSERLGAPVLPVVNIRQVVEHLFERRVLVGEEERLRIEEYLDRHGAPAWT
jgi:orotate phosphoribosyltransferase